MNGKMRGIRLKQVNEEQEGYRALLDFFALDSQRAAVMSEAGSDFVTRVDQGLTADPAGMNEPQNTPPVTARQKLSRLLREELEDILDLLEETLAARSEDR